MEMEQRVKNYWTQRSHDFGTMRKNELGNEMGENWLREMQTHVWHGVSCLCAAVSLIMSVMNVIYNCLNFGEKKNGQRYRTLSIMLPESLDYSGVFDEVLRHYTTDYTLTRVKPPIWVVCSA